jgi:hypothetical protein
MITRNLMVVGQFPNWLYVMKDGQMTRDDHEWGQEPTQQPANEHVAPRVAALELLWAHHR